MNNIKKTIIGAILVGSLATGIYIATPEKQPTTIQEQIKQLELLMFEREVNGESTTMQFQEIARLERILKRENNE